MINYGFAGFEEGGNDAWLSDRLRRQDSIPGEIIRCPWIRLPLHRWTVPDFKKLAARDIGSMRQSDFLALTSQTIEIRKMLYGLLAKIRQGPPPDVPPNDQP